MVLDGLKGFQSKKSKFMTFNYKSADRYLVLPHWSILRYRDIEVVETNDNMTGHYRAGRPVR